MTTKVTSRLVYTTIKLKILDVLSDEGVTRNTKSQPIGQNEPNHCTLVFQNTHKEVG